MFEYLLLQIFHLGQFLIFLNNLYIQDHQIYNYILLLLYHFFTHFLWAFFKQHEVVYLLQQQYIAPKQTKHSSFLLFNNVLLFTFIDIFKYLKLFLDSFDYIKTSKTKANSIEKVKKLDLIGRQIALKLINSNV